MAILKWRLEDDVDDYVKTILESLGLKKLIIMSSLVCLII